MHSAQSATPGTVWAVVFKALMCTALIFIAGAVAGIWLQRVRGRQ